MIFHKILRYQIRYQNFKNNKYVNFIHTEKRNVNTEQGSMLYLDDKKVSLCKLMKL